MATSPSSFPSLSAYQTATLECLTCCDTVTAKDSSTFLCGHTLCNPCVIRLFNLSTVDPEQMPPRCCDPQHPIDIHSVARLFDKDFKLLFNKKKDEFTTQNKLYCPKPQCAEWIPPSSITFHRGRSSARKKATCLKCSTDVCGDCGLKWHPGTNCEQDKETVKLMKLAKDEGWQRCYSCRAVVQLSEGCNHMKCRCTAEFCMLCARPWKTC
ncbi:hypothetical protein K402DRAFT_337830, partial [Aulographum hederae CBS 113979]